MDDEAVHHVCEMLRQNYTLRELSMVSCGVTDAHAASLVDTLQRNSALTNLTLYKYVVWPILGCRVPCIYRSMCFGAGILSPFKRYEASNARPSSSCDPCPSGRPI